MTIDKFGRSLKSQDKNLLKGPKGEGFNLTKEGDYDIQGKRLVKVGPPKHANDATNKGYVDYRSIPFTSDKYDFKTRKITNLGNAVEGSEAVNLNTLNKLALTLTNQNYHASGRQLKDLAKPSDPKDAATKSYVDDSLTPATTLLAKHQVDITTINKKVNTNEGEIAKNKTEHDRQLRKFGTLVFNYINNRETGRAAILPTAGVNDYLNWEELFKLPNPVEKEEEEYTLDELESHDITKRVLIPKSQ